MTFDEGQHPRRNGGKFATKRHAEPAALEKPYGADAYWNSNPDRLALESGFAQQLAGMPWASDTRQLAQRVYNQIAIYRGIPSDAADKAEREATERGDFAVWLVKDDPSPDVRGQAVYAAVLPIIEAVQEHRYADSGSCLHAGRSLPRWGHRPWPTSTPPGDDTSLLSRSDPCSARIGSDVTADVDQRCSSSGTSRRQGRNGTPRSTLPAPNGSVWKRRTRPLRPIAGRTLPRRRPLP